jgi:hypothetical protein
MYNTKGGKKIQYEHSAGKIYEKKGKGVTISKWEEERKELCKTYAINLLSNMFTLKGQ